MQKHKELVEIKGQVERITYANEENGYTIAKMKVPGRNSLVTAAGTLFSLTPGEILILRGYWYVHPKYGEQFTVESYETAIPASVRGMEKYLGSGMIKGIGPVMAKRLVAAFGKETLNVIEENSEKLLEVDGIGEKRIDMIRKAWEDQKEIRDVMVFLQGQGISPAYAVKIYRHYGRDSVRIVRENPYRLAMDIFGIGFLTADRIAEKLGVPKDSENRVEAGILYVLNQLSDDGHVYFPYAPLMEKCGEILKVENDMIPPVLGKVVSQKKIVIDGPEGPGAGVETPENAAVYLARFHVSETGIVDKLSSVLHYPRQLGLMDLDNAVTMIQKNLKIHLSQKQIDGVKASVLNKVAVITGGPGTGKTTIINAIIGLFKGIGRKVFLAAPTGRAAKRMTEATGHEARTLHRLLEYSPAGATFKRNEENPLEADLFVVDEASMVDTVLMYHFLKAVPLKGSLILVGDVDQLPSVGPGNVLKDIIDSGFVPTVRLDEIFRQSRRSMIIVNAHRVNSGQMPVLKPDENHHRDFYFLTVEEPEEAVAKMIQLCLQRIPGRYGFNPVNDIQIITPMHRGTAGVANLNTELQRALNPEGHELARGGRVFRQGDKVMQLRNNYDKDVFNGDIGRILKIDSEDQDVTVDYDGHTVSYDFSELDEISLAYAISVHKSQGSEYPVVIMPVLTQHYMLLQRNLLYTAMTRGKRLVVLVGTRKALAIAVKNNKPQMRYTMLRERLVKSRGTDQGSVDRG
jgi:exodeoxyribonuclease V alpha subunit